MRYTLSPITTPLGAAIAEVLGVLPLPELVALAMLINQGGVTSTGAIARIKDLERYGVIERKGKTLTLTDFGDEVYNRLMDNRKRVVLGEQEKPEREQRGEINVKRRVEGMIR